MEHIKKILNQSIELKKMILSDSDLLSNISLIVDKTTKAFRNDNKVYFCGNGGSAADAQHLAAELSGKFYLDRPPLPAEALHVNSSYLTAVANDFSFEDVFSRIIKANGKKGDVLFAISTSGNSANVVKAIESANALGLVTIGMTGEAGGKMSAICSHIIKVPSNDTPRIQEAHILIGHIICEKVERSLFGND